MRRRSRRMCTSSALRVGAPDGHARRAISSRPTTAPNRSTRAPASSRSTGDSETHRSRKRSSPSSSISGTGSPLDALASRVATRAAHVPVLGRQADPVLERIDRVRRGGVGPDEQQPGGPGAPELAEMESLFRPANQHDVHRGDGIRERFRVCFSVVNRRCRLPHARLAAPSAASAAAATNEPGAEPRARPAAEAVDRPAHRQRRDDLTARTVHRGAHAGDARLALGHRGGPAPLAHGAELGVVRPGWPLSGVGPGQEHLRRRPGDERQARADRDRVPEPRRPLDRRHADPVVALAHVELGALAGRVAQLGQGLRRPLEERRRGATRRCGPTRRGGHPAGTGPARPGRRARAPRAPPRAGARSGAEIPVASTSSASVDGPCSASASRIAADLSMTPTPLRLSI